MRKPYILEKKKIAQAQCEDRRDGEEMETYKGGDENGNKTENSSKTQ